MIGVVLALAGLLGLSIGSFLNVVIYRVPAGKSIVAPPSACPQCDHQIGARDNIPLVSWILLRGRCRNCSAPISPRYPLVELGTATFFVLVALLYAPALVNSTGALTAVANLLVLVSFLYLCAISVALAMIDVEVHRLPNSIVLPAYIVAAVTLTVASVITDDYAQLLRAGIGMVALAVLYFVIAVAYPGGMGFGDVKLAGVLGAYLGWAGWGALVTGSLLAFVLGGIFGLVLILTKRQGRKSGIPFGPWMVAGAWIGIPFGSAIWSNYLSIFGLSVSAVHL
jgi:leader peptidase (prepilin peptidase)/N-methyltransferase